MKSFRKHIRKCYKVYPNKGEVRVAVTTLNREYCKIIIKDTGIGISPSEIPHIFTPLYRGEKSRNRKTGEMD
ncbi:sensor histidine kinase (plasmid) [Bacillus megaterium]|nr:sensor histidine kinase [Priestia megaterium]